MSLFDTARWDRTDVWSAERETPGAGWGDDWAVWYQVGSTVVTDLTEKCVELRWSTDSHTTGDGTFRGDLQPGKCAIRLWDPAHTLEGLNKMGAVWACYEPTGATWCWFYDSVTRALVAPGDPQGADVVFAGSTWPPRLTSPQSYLSFPVQSINARLSALVAAMGSHTELVLPAVSIAQDSAGQSVTAPTSDSSFGNPIAPVYPSYLDQLRAAAANGAMWWQYGRGSGGAGTLTLRYTDWDPITNRILDPSQVVVGPPVSQAIEWVINQGRFTGTLGSGVQNQVTFSNNTSAAAYGAQRMDMRMWGDLSTSGPEYGAASNTLATITNARRDPAAQTLSSVSLQSGARWAKNGRPSSASWDPYAHVFAPNEVAQVLHGGSTYDYYRIASSAHVLNAASWQTTHTLDMYVAATPLP